MADENNNFGNQYDTEPQNNVQYTAPVNAPAPQEEKASVGFAILSFFIPLAGLIIFLTKKDTRPKTAKVSGICALVSFILNILISVIMTAAGGAAFLLADDALTDDSSYSESVDSVDAQEGTISTDNTIGDYGCVVKGAELGKDWDGADAIIVTFEFTNNSSDAISFDIALDARAYQDGIGLESTILASDETSLVDVDIKPGVTKEVKKAYVLNDTSTEVEIEVSELFSFTDEKIVTTINIAQ